MDPQNFTRQCSFALLINKLVHKGQTLVFIVISGSWIHERLIQVEVVEVIRIKLRLSAIFAEEEEILTVKLFQFLQSYYTKLISTDK